MTVSCGIDFGTSNSALAVAKDGRVDLALVEEKSATIPSAIFYRHDAKTPVFGRKAIHEFFEREEGRFMRSLKRIFGTPLMGQGTLVNGKLTKFDDIIAAFIGHLKRTAEQQVAGTLDNVVMGRPVHFIDGDPEGDARAQGELERIAKTVGFRHVEFQFEPIAAAFAHERKVKGEKLALVVDIGGGTSDFTVIRLSEKYSAKPDRRDDILANAGVRIGGNDFDKDLCLSAFMPYLGYRSTYGGKNLVVPASPFHEMTEWSKVNFLYTPKTREMLRDIYTQSHDRAHFGRFVRIVNDESGHKLLSAVEDAKIKLTAEVHVETKLDFIEREFSILSTRAGFDASVEKHVTRISEAITDCLTLAGVDAAAIELVILTGGTAEVPILKAAVKNRFPDAMLSEENKLSSVGIGLGYDSLRRFGAAKAA